MNNRTEARQAIDLTVAELADETDLDHRELAELLLETRDTLMVNGRVPDWLGDTNIERYAEMDRL